MTRINYLLDYFRYLKNPVSTLLFKFSLKKECYIKLKNSNFEFELKTSTGLNKLMAVIPIVKIEKYPDLIDYIKKIDNNEETVVINEINYINIYNNNFKKEFGTQYTIHLEEFFSDDDWEMLNLENRNIIDIGANIADTTLYFAKNGANVIGFEPVKHLYELGLKNISLNPELKENIQFINKGVSWKKGQLNIVNESTESYVHEDDSYQIEVITIKDILNDYNFPADILKMDCEGCEFGIIEKEDLTMFNEIVFEHHSKLTGKDYKPLIEKLKKDGYHINTYSIDTSDLDFDELGIIYAFK